MAASLRDPGSIPGGGPKRSTHHQGVNMSVLTHHQGSRTCAILRSWIGESGEFWEKVREREREREEREREKRKRKEKEERERDSRSLSFYVSFSFSLSLSLTFSHFLPKFSTFSDPGSQDRAISATLSTIKKFICNNT